MATYDLEEQEQLDDLKAWWSRHGNAVSGVVLALCVAFIGVQGWRWYQGNHREAAGTLYGAVSEGVRANDAAKSRDAMAQLTDRYAGTPYAARAALLYAKQLWDAGDKAGARTQLQFVVDRADDAELIQVARYRLAEAELDDGKTDQALRLLDTKTDEAFTGIYADLRGDALLAAGRRDDARAAYQVALAKLDQRSPYRNYVEVKYQSVGGTAAPAGAGSPTSAAMAASKGGATPATTATPATGTVAPSPAAPAAATAAPATAAATTPTAVPGAAAPAASPAPGTPAASKAKP